MFYYVTARTELLLYVLRMQSQLPVSSYLALPSSTQLLHLDLGLSFSSDGDILAIM